MADRIEFFWGGGAFPKVVVSVSSECGFDLDTHVGCTRRDYQGRRVQYVLRKGSQMHRAQTLYYYH